MARTRPPVTQTRIAIPTRGKGGKGRGGKVNSAACKMPMRDLYSKAARKTTLKPITIRARR